MNLAEYRTGLKGRPTEELVRELVGLLGYTVEKLQHMAFIVAELESRGHDTSAIRDRRLMRQLRRIAAGDLLPEVVEHFLGSPTIVEALARLSIAEQRRLLDQGRVCVLVDGQMEPIDLNRLTRESIATAFGPDHVRTEAEQRQHLRSRSPRRVRNPEPVTYRARPDPERGVVKIGNAIAKPEELVSALSELAGPLPEADEAKLTETATVRLTADQKAKLKAACKRTGKLEWRLMLEALHAYGLI